VCKRIINIRIHTSKCVSICSSYFECDMRMLSIHMHSVCECSIYEYMVQAYARHVHARCFRQLSHSKNFLDFLHRYNHTLNICLHFVCVYQADAYTVHKYVEHRHTLCTFLCNICVCSIILYDFSGADASVHNTPWLSYSSSDKLRVCMHRAHIDRASVCAMHTYARYTHARCTHTLKIHVHFVCVC